MRIFPSIQSIAIFCFIIMLSLALAGCAKVAVTPETIQPPDPSLAYNAIEAEPSHPAEVVVRDFSFDASSVTENRSPLHRFFDLFRRSPDYDRRVAIGRKAAAKLSEKTEKKLRKTGLQVVRIGADEPLPAGNFLLVTGRLIDVDEGNRFARVAFGFGSGESRLATEVRVYRVDNREKAEVLALATYADSGKMPGIAPSIGAGFIAIGPITLIKAAQDTVSGGEKIYLSQIDYLAGETGTQVSNYLSQYAAAQHWISQDRAKRVHLAG